MLVLVDTPVWSLALRRDAGRLNDTERAVTSDWAELVVEDRAAIIGPIRTEVLSGIASPATFRAVRDSLRAFPDTVLDREDFESAAELYNRCRSRGIQGSHADFLICAAALRHSMTIFTLDQDFPRYATELGITLHTLRTTDDSPTNDE